MTADEIRKWHMTVDAKVTPELFHKMLLAEIAAQLAELNANLAKLAGMSDFERTFGAMFGIGKR